MPVDTDEQVRAKATAQDNRLLELAKRAPWPAAALRASLRDGYGVADLRADIMAGIVVGVVALPLSMALAIASGVAPQHGLYTAIIAGAITSLLGGSRTQVSGPTAAFVVVLAPIAHRYGLGGLLVATTMAGVMLLAFGFARLGRLIQFIPYPVTTGFTSGIAIVIATLQLKDALGLRVPVMPEHYLARVAALVQALPTAQLSEVVVATLTLALLLLWPRLTRAVPAPLIALLTAAVVGVVAERLLPGFAVETIGDRFFTIVDGVRRAGIPQMLPMPAWPWQQAGADGSQLIFDFNLIRALFAPACAIAMLAAIESLLSAVVADGMTGHVHDPDSELIALGTANVIAPLFGGIAATGAIARTATNIRSGARSPLAGLTHSIFVLAALLALAPVLAYLPMSSLAALLLLVAWNMSEARHVVHAIRAAPRSDVLVMLTCLVLTVVFDMVVAVSTGVVLASLLFMRRMAEVSDTRLVEPRHTTTGAAAPEGVLVYEIAGPLFFGAAQKAMTSLHTIHTSIHTVVIDLRAVPAMDQTGLVNLQSTLSKLRRDHRRVVLAGVRSQPLRVMQRAGLVQDAPQLLIFGSYDEAFGSLAAATSTDLAPTSLGGNSNSGR